MKSKKFEVGQSYIFKYDDGGFTKDSISSCSENIKNKYSKWTQVSGKQVVVIESKVTDSNLIYIKQDGPDFWFRSSDLYLFECTCGLTLLMNRGCQCGFFDIEQGK